MISTANGFGCLGVSDVQGPPSSLWRKPMPNGKTAVLAINGAAIAHSITIDVATVLAPDRASSSAARVCVRSHVRTRARASCACACAHVHAQAWRTRATSCAR